MTTPRRSSNQLALAGVALVLGFLVVVQLRAQTGTPALTGLTAQELTQLIANLNTRNDQLREEATTLRSELRQLTDLQERGATSVGQLEADLIRLRVWAGLEPVVGPGVTVTIDGLIDGQGVEDLLNELRNGGAEAIAVGEIRMAPGAVVAGPPGGLSVENAALTSPLEIRAIGNPPTLAGSLTRIGGIVSQIGATYPGVSVVVSPAERLELPAARRSLLPAHGQPRV